MKVYGPYFRKDGRQHVIISVDGKKKTVSYPRYLIQQVIGRELTDLETVDHIDGDFTNNDLNNLQILTRSANASKAFDDHDKRKKYIELQCTFCQKLFMRTMNCHRRALKKNKNVGFFCSRSCQGKVYH
jgi:hypothetical protein